MSKQRDYVRACGGMVTVHGGGGGEGDVALWRWGRHNSRVTMTEQGHNNDGSAGEHQSREDVIRAEGLGRSSERLSLIHI